MALLIALIVLAVVLGGVGLLVKGLVWLLFIAAALIIASVVVGMMRRDRLP